MFSLSVTHQLLFHYITSNKFEFILRSVKTKYSHLCSNTVIGKKPTSPKNELNRFILMMGN